MTPTVTSQSPSRGGTLSNQWGRPPGLPSCGWSLNPLRAGGALTNEGSYLVHQEHQAVSIPFAWGHACGPAATLGSTATLGSAATLGSVSIPFAWGHTYQRYKFNVALVAGWCLNPLRVGAHLPTNGEFPLWSAMTSSQSPSRGGTLTNKSSASPGSASALVSIPFAWGHTYQPTTSARRRKSGLRLKPLRVGAHLPT